MMLPEIENALVDYKHAAKTLALTIAECYPVGTDVKVESNTAYGKVTHLIEVTGHGSWHFNPTGVFGVNVYTKKRRKFSVRDIVG